MQGGGGGTNALFAFFFALFCASLHPLLPQFALFSFVPYLDKFLTRPVVAEEDENDDDGCPDLEDKDSENEGDVQEPENQKGETELRIQNDPSIKGTMWLALFGINMCCIALWVLRVFALFSAFLRHAF